MNWIEEFRKAYDEVPSQDNEGYVPDRGGFKSGFGAAWHLQQQRIFTLERELELYKTAYPGVLVPKGTSWAHTGPCMPNCTCTHSLNGSNS